MKYEVGDIIAFTDFEDDFLCKITDVHKLDFDEEHPDQLVEQIKDKLKEKYQEYNFVIVVDNDFTD